MVSSETTRSGSLNGRFRKRTPLRIEKMAVVAPIPSASERIATAAKPGLFFNRRSANSKSSRMVTSLQGFYRFFYHPSVKKMNCAIRMTRKTRIVSDHANRCAIAMQFAQQFHNRFPISGIEISCGLICQKNRWTV